jgi:hypothetical protein
MAACLPKISRMQRKKTKIKRAKARWLRMRSSHQSRSLAKNELSVARPKYRFTKIH